MKRSDFERQVELEKLRASYEFELTQIRYGYYVWLPLIFVLLGFVWDQLVAGLRFVVTNLTMLITDLIYEIIGKQLTGVNGILVTFSVLGVIAIILHRC